MQIELTRENDPELELEICAPASSGCPCCELCNYTLTSQGNLEALRWESSELRTNEREWPGTGERRQRRVCLSQRRGVLCSLSNWCTQDCNLENIWWNLAVKETIFKVLCVLAVQFQSRHSLNLFIAKISRTKCSFHLCAVYFVWKITKWKRNAHGKWITEKVNKCLSTFVHTLFHDW